MHKANRNGDAHDSDLAWQALLYASGELDAAQTALFEQRLGNDQAAREAVSLAAPLAQMPVSGAVSRPSWTYRTHVRKGLSRHPSLWERLCGRRAYWGHPVLWGLVGAAAAVVIMACFYHRECPCPDHHMQNQAIHSSGDGISVSQQ